MRNGQYIWERIAGQPAHGTESAVYQPIIEVAGDRRVLIENHLGVITYGKEKIVVKMRYGSVSTCGCSLEIAHMTKEQLTIFGHIHSVALHRREKT